MFGLGIIVSVLAWGLRMIWNLAGSIQSAKDASSANTQAVDKLTVAVNKLTERVARLEGTRRR